MGATREGAVIIREEITGEEVKVVVGAETTTKNTREATFREMMVAIDTIITMVAMEEVDLGIARASTSRIRSALRKTPLNAKNRTSFSSSWQQRPRKILKKLRNRKTTCRKSVSILTRSQWTIMKRRVLNCARC